MELNLNHAASRLSNNLRSVLDHDLELLRENPSAENIYRIQEKTRIYFRIGLISPEESMYYLQQIYRLK